MCCLVGSLPQKLGGPKNIKIWTKFRRSLQLDREYLRNETRKRRTENGRVNCSLSWGAGHFGHKTLLHHKIGAEV